MKKKTIVSLIAIVAIVAVAIFAGCVDQPRTTPEGVPGFEAIFTIAGLLVVAYLLKKKKEAL